MWWSIGKRHLQDVDVKIQVRTYLNFDANVLKHAFFLWIISNVMVNKSKAWFKTLPWIRTWIRTSTPTEADLENVICHMSRKAFVMEFIFSKKCQKMNSITLRCSWIWGTFPPSWRNSQINKNILNLKIHTSSWLLPRDAGIEVVRLIIFSLIPVIISSSAWLEIFTKTICYWVHF